MKRIAVLLIVSATIFSGCTSPKLVRTDVIKQFDYSVSLEHDQANEVNSLRGYAQPYVMDLAALEKLLGDLKYTEKGGLASTEQQSPVFQPAEINRLTPALVEALAKANARQRIRFLSFNQGKALMFSVPRKTEGLLFIESDGRLNLAFNSINADRKPSETTTSYAIDAKIDPLRINTSDTPITSVAPYAELHKLETGKLAPMWIIVDLEKLQGSVSQTMVPKVKESQAVSPTNARQTEAMTTPAENAAQSQASAEALKEDIKNKLKYLKELNDEGLISEKDYNYKKMQLLDKID